MVEKLGGLLSGVFAVSLLMPRLSVADGVGTLVYAQDAVVSTALALAGDTTIEVAAGATVTYTGVISGSGKLVKAGEGTLVLAAENTFTGGADVNVGTLMAGANTSAAFGTGDVTVNATGEKICRVGCCGGTIANDIAFAGATSAAFPGLYVDGKTCVKTSFSGAITAVGDLHLATSCDYGEKYGDTEVAAFTGSITVASPGILAGAPHYLINFNCPVTADVIKGYWTASDLTQDGGNHGAFKLSSTAIVANRAEVDQTRFICGVANVFSKTSIKSLYFTCEHKKNGVGYVDVNGFNQLFRSAYFEKRAGDDKQYYYMSAYVGPDEEGAEIVNTTTAKPTIRIGDDDTANNYSHWYVRMNGYMEWLASNKQGDFYNRHHDLKGGEIYMDYGYFKLCDHTRIAGMTRLLSTAGFHAYRIEATSDDDPLPDLTTINISKSKLYLYNPRAMERFSRRGNLALILGASTQTETSTMQLPSSDSVLRVKSFSVYGEAKAPGLYDLATVHAKITDSCGKILVIGARDSATSTAVTWQGAEGGDFAAADNWSGLAAGDSITNYTSYYAATINSGSSATLNEAVYLHGLTLGGDLAGFSVTTGESVTAGIQLTGPLAFAAKTDAAAARTFDFEAPVNFTETSSFAIPEKDTLVLNAPSCILAAMTNTGSGTLTLNGARVDAAVKAAAGKLALYGHIPGVGSIVSDSSSLWLKDTDVCVDCTFLQGDTYLDLAEGSGVTNVFRGAARFGKSATINVPYPQHAVLIFDGAVDSNGKLAFSGKNNSVRATVIVRNFSSGTRNDGFLHCNYGNRLILDTSGATVASLWVNKDVGNLEFVRDDFFAATWINGNKDRGILRFTAGTVDLHKTRQYGSQICGAATVIGEAPATLEIVRGSIGGDLPTSLTDANSRHTGVIGGGVSVVMNGAGVQTLAGVSTSTGELIVKQGTLALASTASWHNAAAVKVLGGTLQLDGTKPFNRDVTVLDVAGGGVLNVAGRAIFAAARINGVPVAAGCYTVASPGPFAGHVAGVGGIVVGKPGIALFFY